MAGVLKCFKYKTHFVFATEDDLSMLIDEDDSKNTISYAEN